MTLNAYHEPVMADEVIRCLGDIEEGVVLDGTVGGGGHARRILEAFPSCLLLAIDRDPEALAEAGAALASYARRVRLVEGRFDQALETAGIAEGTLAGALLDLGVSSWQIDADERGLTFRRGAELDGRMGRREEGTATVADLLNTEPEAELARIFFEYGEEPRSRRLAREIVKRRATVPLRTSDDLVGALQVALGRAPSVSEKARVFQALRIALNDEMKALDAALPLLRDALAPGSAMVVISYHSGEDRRVKDAFREWSRECICPPGFPICRCRGRALGTTVTRKPLRPSVAEVQANPRARSARLRAWKAAA